MTLGEISTHLLTDWIPSVPAAVGASFMGWPPYLLESVLYGGNDHLTLRVAAGRSDRQWKGVLSWMLGVAGARHVLKAERYRWIAPLSAFYPDAIEPVDLTQWHGSFPPSRIKVTPLPRSPSRLRPDYLALRPSSSTTGSLDWAIVEAKGTRSSLTGMDTCKPKWSDQARNAVVALDGTELLIPRRLVVATRINPNAARAKTRRLQVRSWNQTKEPEEPGLTIEGAVEIVAAHLFGFFKGVGLVENAQSIALSVQMRARDRYPKLFAPSADEISRVSDLAEIEFEERTRRTSPQVTSDWVIDMETPVGPLNVEIAEPVLELVRHLRLAKTPGAAGEVLRKTDTRLDLWERSHTTKESDERRVALPFGVQMQLPPGFNLRR